MTTKQTIERFMIAHRGHAFDSVKSLVTDEFKIRVNSFIRNSKREVYLIANDQCIGILYFSSTYFA